jgi:rhamnosyltransferase
MISSEKPNVAVILATYEPCDFLYEQVESIMAQDNVNVEIFIFDDGTVSQKSLDILNNLRNTVFKIIKCSASKSAGKNFIRAISNIELHKYKYIALSDQDDIWLVDKLDRAVSKLVEHDASGYSSNLTLYNGVEDYGTLIKSSPQRKHDYHFQGASAGCTYVLRTDLVQVIKSNLIKYDYMNHVTRISHDWLIYYLARTNGFIWYMDKVSKIKYRQHDRNVYGAKRSMLTQLKMVFGSWYTANVNFVSKYRNTQEDPFDVNKSLYEKLKSITSLFQLRRNLIGSILCYIFWLVKYNNN